MKHLVKVFYTNHKGETATRLVWPIMLWYGKTKWHPEPQWLLECFDEEKGQKRDFAMSDIHSWEDVNE